MVTIEGLRRKREALVLYARVMLDSEDWHALSDAANDLREVDSAVRTLGAVSHPPDGRREAGGPPGVPPKPV